MKSVRRICAVVWLLAILALLPTFAASQAINLLTGGATAAEDTDDAGQDVAKIIEQAAASGVGVIVIDAQGNVLSPAAEPTAPEPVIPSAAADGGLRAAQENVIAFREALYDRLTQLPSALNEVAYILRASSPDGTIFAYVETLLLAMVLFAIGMVAQKYIYGRRIAGRFIIPLIKENPKGYAEKIPFLTVRLIGGIIGTLFAMSVAYLVGFIFFGPIEDSAIQFTAILINVAYFLAMTIINIWRMILSPYLAQYRIPRLSNRDAVRLHLWLSGVVILGGFTFLFTVWIEYLGLNEDVAVFMNLFMSFFVMVANLALVWANRSAITGSILSGDDIRQVSWPTRMLARFWAPLANIYILFAYGEQVYDRILGGFGGVPLLPGGYAILTAVLVVYGLINFGIERWFSRARAIKAVNAEVELEPGEDAPLDAVPAAVLATRARVTTFEGLARRVAAILAFVAGFAAFLSMWQPNTDMMTESLPSRTLDVIVILFIGYIIYDAFRIWIDQKIAEEQGDEEPAELGDEGGGSSATRLATLLPLFKNVVLIVIALSILLIVLMELGVNVGPLFAGAGIVGVAIGFGSQSLVRDIFSGAFFLFDDAFRKGEYIEVGEVKGTVENISVRSFQLRHHLGKLHTIPFGEIQVLSNYSRDWVMMKLPLRVTYDTDVDQVRKLIKKLGQQLLEDPIIGPDFLQPLKSQGVIEMQDSAMIIRVKFMTKPGDQWVIRKRVFQEIRALFEANGIKFAHREVTVRLADGANTETLTPQQKDGILAAAEATLDEEDMADAMGGDDR